MSVDMSFREANAAMKAGRWPEAERRYRALTRVKPSWAWHNLGVLYVTTGRFTEAELAFAEAMAADPGLPDPRHSLAMLMLGDGRFGEGWPLYEARRDVRSVDVPRPNLSCPEWRGEDLAGKRLLVIKEQGLGDQIMMVRFVPALEALGAKVTFLCNEALAPLFRANGVAAASKAAGSDVDYWTLMFSIPARLGLTVDGLDGAPYLAAPEIRSGGVGVKPRGGTTHANDRNRSLPPDAAAELLGLGRDLDPEATGATDFLETARIVAGLDLVITVDTAVAHLAGALGKPVWILLSAVETDWRWLRGRRDSPWYSSARLYRQAAPGRWGPALKQVKADLAALRAS